MIFILIFFFEKDLQKEVLLIINIFKQLHIIYHH